jgi:hypothetical protein
MPLNIPLPDAPGEGLLKGLRTGSDMFAKIMNAKYNNSLHPSGDVANAMYVEQIKNQYGENDPRYLQAKAAHDMALAGHQSLIDYRDILNQTAGPRYSSTLGKTILEGNGQGAADIIKNRGKPGSGVPANAFTKTGDQYYDAQGKPVYADDNTNPRTPEEREAYERSINKQTGDADARNTYLRAQNLDKTRRSINVDDLTRYSGPKNAINYGLEFLKTAVGGQPSEEFLAHAKAVNSASLMADQMRQFYKDSIQPSAMDRLRELSNPSAWYKNPAVAKAQFEQLNQILDQETETYKKAGTSPIKLNKIEYEDGKFKLAGKQTPEAADKVAAEEQSGGPPPEGEDDDQLLAVYGPELIKVNPKYTKENLLHTAKLRKIPIGKLIDQLMAKGQ